MRYLTNYRNSVKDINLRKLLVPVSYFNSTLVSQKEINKQSKVDDLTQSLLETKDEIT
jgi:hypothetical protein